MDPTFFLFHNNTILTPKTLTFVFCLSISSFGHPPELLEAIIGLFRPRQYICWHFQPGWQELLPVDDPQRSQTYVFGSFPPGAFIFIFFFPKTDIWALGPVRCPFGDPRAWAWDPPAPAPDELLIPNQAPLPSRPGGKYVSSLASKMSAFGLHGPRAAQGPNLGAPNGLGPQFTRPERPRA